VSLDQPPGLAEVLSLAAASGVKLFLDGDRLAFRAPKGAMTAELRRALAEHKPALLSLLQKQERMGLAPPLLSVAASSAAAAPLCSSQERFWFLDRLVPNSPLYNVHFGVHMKGVLNKGALRQSLSALIARHEVLRTTFREQDGRPYAVVSAALALALEEVDLSALGPPEKAQALSRLAAKQRQAAFDLARGPLLRMSLITLASDEHLLLVTQHHIITDGWSIGVFLSDLARLYRSYEAGEPASLPELPLRYTDYARLEGAERTEEAYKRSLAWWQKQLFALPRLELPLAHALTTAPTSAGGAHSFTLDRELGAGLRALACRAGCTLFVTLLSAWALLLHRYSQQVDFAIGTVTARRDRRELEGLLGSFVNTLVLRCDVSGDPTFLTLQQRLREVVHASVEHEIVPFDEVVKSLGVARGASLNPLLQVSFVLENLPAPDIRIARMSWSLLLDQADGGVEGTAKFDLSLALTEQREALFGTLEYAADFFQAETIERMAHHLQVLLAAVVANPELPISKIPILTAAERHQLLVEWNDTARDFPSASCIHELFAEQAAKTPDALAVSFEEQQLTYGELDARSNQLARYLQGLKVGPGTLVALCIERSPEMVVALLGILKAGGAYLPLDPAYPKERLAFMLDDAQAPVLLTQAKLLQKLPHGTVRIVCLDEHAAALFAQRPEKLVRGAVPEDLAYVIYTSGSTGKPKGTLISHAALSNHGQAMRELFALAPQDRVLQFASLSFDAAAEEIFPTLISGATLVLRTDEVLLPSGLTDWVLHKRLTVLNLPSGFWQTWVDELVRSDTRLPASLLLVIIGGEEAHAATHSRWRRIAPAHVRLLNTYGPTETTITALAYDVPVQAAPFTCRTIPIGRPISNVEVYILDAHLQPVPIGVPGELHIGGQGLSQGYLNQEELNRKKFIAHPFCANRAARLYKTGDRGRFLPDGNVEFLGRDDRQIKLRGFRIELGEIEAVLSTHDEVAACAVLLRQDLPGEEKLVAYVVVRSASVSPRVLREYARSKLPDYMLPSAFVKLAALPLLPNGKLDRTALLPPDIKPDSARAETGPRSAVEDVLIELWEALLKTRPIGIHDDFFALGGHSLLAVKLMSAIQSRLGHSVPLATMFQARTVASLAAALQSSLVDRSAAPLVRLRETGAKRPFFCVHPGGGTVLCYEPLARALGPEQPFFGLQAQFLDLQQALAATVEDMAERYLGALRQVQQRGPYQLGGWSFGGLVAYEMAHRLLRAGQEVRALALFDTSFQVKARSSDPTSALAEAVRHFGITRPAEELCSLGPLRAFDALIEELGALAGVEEATARRLAINFLACESAAQKYVPGRYLGRLVLFRPQADAEAGSTSREEALAWSRWCEGPIEVRRVPGTHDDMLRSPHVAVLASALREVLD